MTPPPSTAPANGRGSLLLILALALFTVELACIRLLGGSHALAQLVFWRAASQMLILTPLLVASHGTVLRTGMARLHWLRGALSAICMFSFFYAFQNLPMAFATAISFTQPLFLVPLAAVLLGEVVGRRRMAATALGFAGALIVLRPGAMPMDAAILSALLGAFCGAILLIITKRLASADTTMTIMTWSALTTTGFYLVPGLLTWTMPASGDLWLFALLGIGGPIGQFLMINAFRMADASALAPIDYTRLIMAAVVGYVIFAELPDLWTLLGSLVIAASAVLTSRTGGTRASTPARRRPAAPE